MKTEEEPHQYFTQGFYFIRGVASAAREEMCQENNGDTVFAFCYYTEPKKNRKNLEERSPLPLFSAGSPIRQMRFATYFYGKKVVKGKENCKSTHKGKFNESLP